MRIDVVALPVQAIADKFAWDNIPGTWPTYSDPAYHIVSEQNKGKSAMIDSTSARRSPLHAGSKIAALMLGTSILLLSPVLKAQSSVSQLDADTRAAADEILVELKKAYVEEVNSPNIALIEILARSESTPGQLAAATARMVKTSRNEELRIGGQFLPPSEMAKLPATLEGIALSTPLIVLVDERTGGTAEIVAAALQDHYRAAIVGRKTAGKSTIRFSGSVLHGGFFSMTVGELARPSGKAIEGNGVMPDHIVADKDLETALALLPH